LSGLASGAYDVYVYTDGDNHGFTRSGGYTVTGAAATTVQAIDVADTNFTGTFVPASGGAGNYVKVRVTGTGFTVTATPLTGTNATLRAPINGLQIVPVAP
jgi:hypothetical protein